MLSISLTHIRPTLYNCRKQIIVIFVREMSKTHEASTNIHESLFEQYIKCFII